MVVHFRAYLTPETLSGGFQQELTHLHSLVLLCCCSLAKSCPILWNPMNYSMPGSLSFTISQSLPKLMSIESVMPSMPPNHLILCCPFLLLPSIFPSIRVFIMSRLSASGGQSIGASASASVLPMNTQDWFPLGLTGLITFLSEGFSRVFSSTTFWKYILQQILWS